VLLHDHPDFEGLLSLVAAERGLDPVLVEKDYWIMHCLWGLQQQGFRFELKGGTSLSKGYGVIHRFSEDIDLRIEPQPGQDVKYGRTTASWLMWRVVGRFTKRPPQAFKFPVLSKRSAIPDLMICHSCAARVSD